MMNRILFIAFVTLSMVAVGCGNGKAPVNSDPVHQAPQANYYVAVTGSDENDGTSENVAFATLQEAILNAEEGNIIEVLPGTYTGEGNTEVELLGKKITLQSQGATIDCEGLGRAFHIHEGETPETVLDGFTIVNGVAPMGTYGMNDYEMSYGGGIFVDGANPTLQNLTIQDCEAGLGGGLTLRYSNASVSDVRIDGNSATYFGGGGVAFVYSNSHFERVTITNNYAKDFGGGILYNTSHPTLNKVTIASNTTGRFGSASYTTIDYEDYNGLPLSITTSRPILTNCIVWDNEIDGWEWSMITPPWNLKNDVSVNYSNVQGSWEGTGNIDSDPFFNSDFTLQVSSPCIDAGTSYFEWAEEELYDYNDYNDLEVIVSPDDVVVDMDIDQFEGAEPDMGAAELNND